MVKSSKTDKAERAATSCATRWSQRPSGTIKAEGLRGLRARDARRQGRLRGRRHLQRRRRSRRAHAAGECAHAGERSNTISRRRRGRGDATRVDAIADLTPCAPGACLSRFRGGQRAALARAVRSSPAAGPATFRTGTATSSSACSVTSRSRCASCSRTRRRSGARCSRARCSRPCMAGRARARGEAAGDPAAGAARADHVHRHHDRPRHDHGRIGVHRRSNADQ